MFFSIMAIVLCGCYAHHALKHSETKRFIIAVLVLALLLSNRLYHLALAITPWFGKLEGEIGIGTWIAVGVCAALYFRRQRSRAVS